MRKTCKNASMTLKKMNMKFSELQQYNDLEKGGWQRKVGFTCKKT